MNESLFGSPLFASALFGVAMFFFFRWVFVERYSAEEAKNYSILIAFVCAVIKTVPITQEQGTIEAKNNI